MSEDWVVGTCWACGSDNIHQNPDRRYATETKYICRGCRNHMGSIRPLKSRFKENEDSG